MKATSRAAESRRAAGSAVVRDELRRLGRALAALERRLAALEAGRAEPAPAWLSTGEAAQIFGCSKPYVRRLVTRVTGGRAHRTRLRIPVDVFRAILIENRAEKLPVLDAHLAARRQARFGAL